MCAVRVDGSVSCWGRYEIVRRVTPEGNLPPPDYVQATAPAGEFISVSAGEHHTCGVRPDGSVACWGNDAYGKATPPKGEFSSVSAGRHHTCGVRTDGSVACWGTNVLTPSWGITGPPP